MPPARAAREVRKLVVFPLLVESGLCPPLTLKFLIHRSGAVVRIVGEKREMLTLHSF